MQKLYSLTLILSCLVVFPQTMSNKNMITSIIEEISSFMVVFFSKKYAKEDCVEYESCAFKSTAISKLKSKSLLCIFMEINSPQ